MRILLLCSGFNGLTQRAWIALRNAGHDVRVELAVNHDAIVSAVALADPDLIICPFLRERVPAEVWMRYRTIIVHPGPKGDRGPSSLDWAITDGESHWGVTALQAVDEMDAGPIWGTRTFALDPTPPRKSSLYNGAVADAAIELIQEVVAKAVDPTFVPEPLDYRRGDVPGRLRPAMRQSDRAFAWSDSTEQILRRIRAADGSPGIRTTLCDTPVSVFDAYVGPACAGEPGTVALRHRGAVLVRTGDGGIWVGHVRRVGPDGEADVKLPATIALGDRVAGVPEATKTVGHRTERLGWQDISYQRFGDVGVLTFDFYNGAMSTGQCRRLTAALRRPTANDTRVLLLRGGEVFSNGIHLNMIETAPNPALEAWRNIQAIDDVCRAILTCAHQIVVASVGGNAGAGGLMMALGADRVLLRDGVVLNPHYKTMGLFGSEYWTFVLPRRVGDAQAGALTQQCLPVGSAQAARIGLVDLVVGGSPAEFEQAAFEHAAGLAASKEFAQLLESKRATRAADDRHKPLEAYRIEELAEMSRDIFDDRHGFVDARHAFVTKRKVSSTPGHLALHRTGRPSTSNQAVAVHLAS